MATILAFAPFFILNNTVLAFVRNDNNPKLAMTAMLVGSFSNVILDYIFLFPFGMGMFGAAFATSLSPIISLGILSTHFAARKRCARDECVARGDDGFDLRPPAREAHPGARHDDQADEGREQRDGEGDEHHAASITVPCLHNRARLFSSLPTRGGAVR